jgi:UDP-GlcNAc:undecaprenyl-phosphate GlcNAc-1-phosphate transferase
MVAGLCFVPDAAGRLLPLLIGGTIIFAINLADDVRELSARFRFFAETAVALAVVLTSDRISFLPAGPIGDSIEVVVTVVWYVGLLNAFNYLDGLNGLATGLVAVNALFFGLLLFYSGQIWRGMMAFTIMAACLGFLPHNFRRARMFLGDAGSTFLGFMLAGIGVAGDWAQDSVVKVSIPILILGVPIFDMVFTTLMRIREGRVHSVTEWMKYAGRDHFHHYLVDLGLSHAGAAVFIWVVAVGLGIGAVMVSNDRAWEGVLTLLHASIIFAMIGLLMVLGRRRGGAGE